MSGTDFFDRDLLQKRDPNRSALGQARESGTGVRPDEIPVRPISDLNLTRMTRHREEINQQATGAMRELEQLRRRQSELEREKQYLDELVQKQAEYERGKLEMLDSLNQSIVNLEKQETQATRLVETCAAIRKRFVAMLTELVAIKEETWTDETFREELNRAGALVENARKEYNKALATVEAVGGVQMPVVEPRVDRGEAGGLAFLAELGFKTWVKIGCALILPLGGLMAIVGLIVYWLGHAR